MSKQENESEIYNMMTNYQDPELFKEFWNKNKQSLYEYCLEYVLEAKHDMLPETKMSNDEVASAMHRYLVHGGLGF